MVYATHIGREVIEPLESAGRLGVSEEGVLELGVEEERGNPDLRLVQYACKQRTTL